MTGEDGIAPSKTASLAFEDHIDTGEATAEDKYVPA
jgi:hypothetical protein